MIRQSKAFLIMMDNYDRVLEATSLAYNSAGSSAKEFARWQESIEGRTNELKSAIEQFASETIDNKFVKSIISATTEIVKFGTEVGGAIPVITSLGIAFLAFQKEGLVNLFFTKAITQMKILTTTTIGAVGAVTTLQMVLGVGLAIGGILAVSYAINAMSERAEKAREAVSILSNELSDMQENSKTVEQLSKRFDELRKKNNLSNVEQQEFLDIQNQLRELLPEVNGYFDTHGNFIISEKENIQSLNKEYREYIALKRQELADASKESALYTIRDYEIETNNIKYLKQYLEYAKKAVEGTLQTSDLDQVNFLQSYLGVKFDKASIEKALRVANDNIKQSVSDMQKDIRNQVMNTSEWNKLAEDSQNAILKALSEVSDVGLAKLSEAITKGDMSAQEFIDTISNTNVFKDFKKQLENAKDSTDELSDSIETLESKLESLSNTRSQIESLTNILNNLNSGNFTAEDMEKLLSVSEEFLPYLNDEIALREKLNEVIAESKSTYKATYEYMILLSSDTYKTLTNKIEKYFNDLGIAYKDDLKNYKDLEKAKATISSNLIKELAKKWGDYFSVGLNGVVQDNDLAGGRSTRVHNKQLAEAQKIVDGFYKVFDDIQIDPITIDFGDSKVGGGLKTAIDEAVEAVKAIISEYEKELKSLTDKDIQINLQQQLVGDNTEEYLALEKQKYENILAQETLLQQKIAELQRLQTEVAKEEAEKLIDTYYDLVSQRYSIIANLQSTQISIYKDQIDSLNKQKDALSNLHKYTMQMIKDELNAKKKSIQDELKGIEAVFNAKKKALRDEKDSRSYEKGLTEKSSLVADLENQLAIIKNDETAIAKRKKLEEELAKAKEDLADYQYEHSIDLQEKALDTELEKVKKTYEDRIEELDSTLSNEVKMRELADKRIAKSGEKLYKELINYSKEYGSITEDEIKDAWDNAKISLLGYKSTQEDVLETLKRVTNELSKIEKLNVRDYSATSGYNTATWNDKLAQMKSNSAKWNISNETERKRLAEENQKLGKALGLTYDSATGIWYFDKEKKYRVYHQGGIVGGSSYATKDTEELAKLLKGELVITPPQATKIMDSITNNNSNSNINISVPIVIEGNADQSVVDLLEEKADWLANIVAKKFNEARANTGWKKPVKSF